MFNMPDWLTVVFPVPVGPIILGRKERGKKKTIRCGDLRGLRYKNRLRVIQSLFKMYVNLDTPDIR